MSEASSGSFEGKPAFQRTITGTGTLSKNLRAEDGTNTKSSSDVIFYDENYVKIDETGTNAYTVSDYSEIPNDVKVGDSGVFSKSTTYSNNSKTSILEKSTTTYKVEKYLTAILVILEATYVDSNQKVERYESIQFIKWVDDKDTVYARPLKITNYSNQTTEALIIDVSDYFYGPDPLTNPLGNWTVAITAQAPKVTASGATISLSATASNNGVGAIEYCFQGPSKTKPVFADNSCFGPASIKTVDRPSFVASYWMWARDIAGQVSGPYRRDVGPCGGLGLAEAAKYPNQSAVCVETNLGQMVLLLEDSKAPLSVKNFLKYVNDGFYTDTVFHRIIKTLMVQSGGSTVNSNVFASKTPTYAPIPLENTSQTGLLNVRGALSMARTSDINSATSQFYINTVNNAFLDWTSDALTTTGTAPNTVSTCNGCGYAVFGRLLWGWETLDTVANFPVSAASRSSEVSQPNPISAAPVIHWAYQVQ